MLLYQRQPPQRNCQIVKLPLRVFYDFLLKAFSFTVTHYYALALAHKVEGDKFKVKFQ